MVKGKRVLNMDKKEKVDPVGCSFCDKSHEEVFRLISGKGVYICNDCVGLCNEIIFQEIARYKLKEKKGK